MAASSEGGIAGRFVKVRGSYAFMIGIVTFGVTWGFLKYIWPWFDPGWGGYNTLFSTESSLAMAWLTRVSEKFEDFMREHLEYTKHLLEAQHALLQRAIGDEEDKTCGSGSGASSSSPPSSD